MATYYKATTTDGRIITRSTESRAYTFATAAGTWHSTQALAAREALARGVEVLEATEIQAPEYRAILKAQKAAFLARSCKECKGKGRVILEHPVTEGQCTRWWDTCPSCKGTGALEVGA
jgi:ribosomal protein S9